MTFNFNFFMNIFFLFILINQYLSLSISKDKISLITKVNKNIRIKQNEELLNEKINFEAIQKIMNNKRNRRSTSFDINSYLNNYDVKIESECKINSMYLQLEDLGWQDFVLAPKGFDFNYCEGKCVNDSKCCEPIKFTTTSIIIKEKDKFKLKIFDNLLVTKCGSK